MKKIFKKINNFITYLKEKNVFFYAFLFVLIAMFFYKMKPYDLLNNYVLSFYRISYRFGLLSRAFIGTIFELLGLTTKSEIVVMITFIIFSFMVFIAYILNKIVKKYNNSFIILVLLFIFNTGSITNMYTMLEFGRMDIFTILYGILSIYLIYKKKLYFIPIVSIFAMLTHENYMIWVSPLICMILMYEYFKGKCSNKQYLKVFIINLFVLFSMFIVTRYIILNPPYKTAEEFQKAVQINTDFDIDYYAINDYYYMTKERNAETFYYFLGRQNMLDYLIAGIGYFLLFGILCLTCFIPIYKKEKGITKIVFLVLIASCLSSVVLFFKVCDYGRWYMYMINALILLAVYLLLNNIKTLNRKTSQLIMIYAIVYIAFSIFFFSTSNIDTLKFKDTDLFLHKINQVLGK